jgi:peptidoglycan/xylan/chitin deacetylase (PgdA/CDA1 family)
MGKWIDKMASGLSLKLLGKFSGVKTIFPFYHTVHENPPVYLSKFYKVKNENEFRKDLDFLLANFKSISLHDLMNGDIDKKKPSFHLSFDDGLRGCHDIIAPILIEKGIPATFFINPLFVDNKDMFFRYKVGLIMDNINKGKVNEEDLEVIIFLLEQHLFWEKNIERSLLNVPYERVLLIDQMAGIAKVDLKKFLEQEKPYMSTLQVNDLIAKGFTIGAHSLDHPLYNRLHVEDQVEQTIKSIKQVKVAFNLNYSAFSFPFTDHGVRKDFFDKLAKQTNTGKLLLFGTAGMKKDQYGFHLQRVPAEDRDVPLEQRIKGEYLYYLMKAPLGKNKIKRR